MNRREIQIEIVNLLRKCKMASEPNYNSSEKHVSYKIMINLLEANRELILPLE